MLACTRFKNQDKISNHRSNVTISTVKKQWKCASERGLTVIGFCLTCKLT